MIEWVFKDQELAHSHGWFWKIFTTLVLAIDDEI